MVIVYVKIWTLPDSKLLKKWCTEKSTKLLLLLSCWWPKTEEKRLFGESGIFSFESPWPKEKCSQTLGLSLMQKKIVVRTKIRINYGWDVFQTKSQVYRIHTWYVKKMYWIFFHQTSVSMNCGGYDVFLPPHWCKLCPRSAPSISAKMHQFHFDWNNGETQ